MTRGYVQCPVCHGACESNFQGKLVSCIACGGAGEVPPDAASATRPVDALVNGELRAVGDHQLCVIRGRAIGSPRRAYVLRRRPDGCLVADAVDKT